MLCIYITVQIQNGATFVIVDKTTNPKDGTTALLIQGIFAWFHVGLSSALFHKGGIQNVDFSNHFSLKFQMMVVGWILRQWGIAWVLDSQIRNRIRPLADVWIFLFILTYICFCGRIFRYDYASRSSLWIYDSLDGNGFKTSTMRLGADVIVFSRHFKDQWVAIAC